MSDTRDGVQKGPQRHAEGQHGRKTHDALLEQLHSGGEQAGQPDRGDAPQEKGEHHIFEDRQQHDEADKNSDKHRLARELGTSASGDLRPPPDGEGRKRDRGQSG